MNLKWLPRGRFVPLPQGPIALLRGLCGGHPASDHKLTKSAPLGARAYLRVCATPTWAQLAHFGCSFGRQTSATECATRAQRGQWDSSARPEWSRAEASLLPAAEPTCARQSGPVGQPLSLPMRPASLNKCAEREESAH